MPRIKRDTLVVGIDPGKTGGLCYLHDVFNRVDVMPDTERNVCEWFETVAQIASDGGYSVKAVIEKVGPMPKQGVTSVFTFGQGYGGLRMALIANRIPFEEIPPQKWMKEYSMSKKKGETTTVWKKRLLGKAQQLFPNLSGLNKNNADAVLIAEYARRTL